MLPTSLPTLPLTLRKAEEGKVAKSVGTVAPGRCDTVSLRTSSWQRREGNKGSFRRRTPPQTHPKRLVQNLPVSRGH